MDGWSKGKRLEGWMNGWMGWTDGQDVMGEM